MKKFKVTWILGGLFLCLAAYVYVVEIEGAKKKQILKEQKEQLFVFDDSQVEQVTLSNSNGLFTAKRMGEDRWMLEEPMKVLGDKNSWGALVSTVGKLKPSRVISEASTDLAPFGLKDPEITVTLLLTGNETPLILKVGDENPVGDSLFVTDQTGKKVVLAPRTLRFSLDKDLSDLREKKLFTFNADETQEVEIKKGSARLVLKKEGEQWHIISSKEKKEAEGLKVGRLLNTLNNLRVSEFTDESPKTLDSYGLDNPSFTVAVRNGKMTQLELLFGKEDLSKKVYLSKKAEKPVYLVNAQILRQLSTDASKFLKKEVKKKSEK